MFHRPLREIRCYSGTNAVGARRELLQAVKELNHDEMITKKLRQQHWLKIQPTYCKSHEPSQVKANKDCMKDSWHLNLWIQHRICLGNESLQTLMCQVESIINSILFTVISSDAKDLVPRSPNQILRMKISYVLSPSVTSLHNTWFHALSLEQR